MIEVKLDTIAERELQELDMWYQRALYDINRHYSERLHNAELERRHGIARIFEQLEKRIKPQSILTKWGYLFV